MIIILNFNSDSQPQDNDYSLDGAVYINSQTMGNDTLKYPFGDWAN